MPSPAKLTGNEIRQRFLDFYATREHRVLPSASLVPADPTVLLTIAGMLPFKPIFLGQEVSPYARATTSQKCIRTNDIENVGRTARHHTFFEMLGNFSFGDYFKEQAVEWAWELATQVFALPPERLVVSVFEDDDEAFALWRDKIGVNPQRIKRMGAADNFWESGPTGPCGPCSEIYYDFAPELGNETIDLEDDSRFIEFYNLVFMQYNRDIEGNFTPLKSKNIDTGMGLERMAQILQGVPNNYETDLIFPIVKVAADVAGLDYYESSEETKVSLKVIGDHVRAVVHSIADGIRASNTGRGYILRRLIRRVVRHGRLIGIEGAFIDRVAAVAIDMAAEQYPQVKEKTTVIMAELAREESQFLKTLDRGEKLLAEAINRVRSNGESTIPGEDVFKLYDTYGFPMELTAEIAAEVGLMIDEAGYNAELERQRELGRNAHKTIDLTVRSAISELSSQLPPTQFNGYTANSQTSRTIAIFVAAASVEEADSGTPVQIVLDNTPFYAEGGGQIGDRGYLTGDETIVRIDDVQKENNFFIHIGTIERGSLRVGDSLHSQIDRRCRRAVQANHSATHLLQAALKKEVDESISQAGSLVSFDRFRFDFNYSQALTAQQLKSIEELINTWIAEGHDATVEKMPIEAAKSKGAIAMFGEKYGDEVRVVDFPGVSMELCGGTHVNNTAEIGAFKIVSETGIADGVRRIEAVAGSALLEYANVRDRIVRELGNRFKAKPEEIVPRIDTIQEQLKTAQKQLETARSELAIVKAENLLDTAETVGEFKLIVANLGDIDANSLPTAAERLLQKIGEGAIVLASIPEANKVSIVVAASKAANNKGLQAGKFIGTIAKICGGGGGGRPNLAQAGGKDTSQLPLALSTAKSSAIEILNA
jgi:alanyl-tRNA synthetase